MNAETDIEIREAVFGAYAGAGIQILELSIRRFPGETIVIVEVEEPDYDRAISVAGNLDKLISHGFVTVRRSVRQHSDQLHPTVSTLIDPRVSDLIEILNARSRTSEQQPSLRYIPDTLQTLNVATSRRHHLIFGRRGVGKTALMLETKKLIEKRGAFSFWINAQTIRSLNAYEAFLTIVSRLCDVPEQILGGRTKLALSIERANELRERISTILASSKSLKSVVDRLVPDVQQLFQIFGRETQDDLYIFLDDLHYLATKEQPLLLDLVHAISRDNPVWIKAAGIRHLCRWFTNDPPMGLQTGHDAALINLDVTLEQPAKAKAFLTSVLITYIEESKLGRVAKIISSEATDRLVLASGGVPRDFLVLCATAIQVARQRANAKTVGVQDVNESAGRFAQVKLQELEDDAASAIGHAESRMTMLNALREFLIEDKKITLFRLDFRDKESQPKEYELLQSLMDLRLLHLINAGLSDEREAGRRSEVYMLDLSQFSGTRFMRNLRVLDFTKGHLVLKSTGGGATPRKGDTPHKLQGILRRAPLFDLHEYAAQH